MFLQTIAFTIDCWLNVQILVDKYPKNFVQATILMICSYQSLVIIKAEFIQSLVITERKMRLKEVIRMLENNKNIDLVFFEEKTVNLRNSKKEGVFRTIKAL